MAKIKPSEQTRELSKARWEMLLRNDKAREAFESQYCVQSWRKWFDAHPDTDYAENADELFKRTQCSRAVREIQALRQIYFRALIDSWDQDLKLSEQDIWELYRNRARGRANADEIAKELTTGDIENTLFVCIDLNRPKDVIMAEVAALVSKNHKGTDRRLRWLPIAQELIAAWDLRLDGKSFEEIARSLNISEDTARKRFYSVYELITGEPYNKDAWADLFRAYFEKELRANPQDAALWKTVARLEEKSATELPTDQEAIEDREPLSMALIIALQRYLSLS